MADFLKNSEIHFFTMEWFAHRFSQRVTSTNQTVADFWTDPDIHITVVLTLLTQKHTCMINTKTTKMANWAWNKIFPFTSGLTWKSVVRFWHGLCFSQICVREQNAHSNRKFSSLEHFVYEFFSSRNEPRRSNTNFSRLIYVRSDYMQLASKAIFPLIEKW